MNCHPLGEVVPWSLLKICLGFDKLCSCHAGFDLLAIRKHLNNFPDKFCVSRRVGACRHIAPSGHGGKQREKGQRAVKVEQRFS